MWISYAGMHMSRLNSVLILPYTYSMLVSNFCKVILVYETCNLLNTFFVGPNFSFAASAIIPQKKINQKLCTQMKASPKKVKMQQLRRDWTSILKKIARKLFEMMW